MERRKLTDNRSVAPQIAAKHGAASHHIVIVGAGAAGLAAASSLLARESTPPTRITISLAGRW
jgi:NADPH-dependent 2,4-dienoyl-CoA reductase/sulfur reductase-like enzyme